MNTVKEREAVKRLGRTSSWSEKVDKMSDTQVLAIYLRLRSERKL
jgi:hypothetical protein